MSPGGCGVPRPEGTASTADDVGLEQVRFCSTARKLACHASGHVDTGELGSGAATALTSCKRKKPWPVAASWQSDWPQLYAWKYFGHTSVTKKPGGALQPAGGPTSGPGSIVQPHSVAEATPMTAVNVAIRRTSPR